MSNHAYGIAPPSYRLPETAHVGLVRLQVSDLGRSVEFYTDVLGFTAVTNDAKRVTLTAENDTRPLIQLVQGARGPLTARRLGLYHFAILLPSRKDLGSFLAHLGRNRIRPGASDHLVSEALYISDPDELGIEVYRDRERSEWKARNRELEMASNALDFDDLIRAGGHNRWDGMPSGTTIGHVHLHVGSLDAAKLFYHEAVGLDLVVWSYPQALFLSAGGYHHHLGINTWAGPDAVPAGADEAKLLDWELVLPSGEAVVEASEHLTRAGFAPSPEEVGGSIVTDPWGTNLRITAAE